VLEAAQRATGMTPNRARALLGRFLFGGELAEKPLAGLSGGERRRLSLAILTGSSANVLILDEPTNHLDVESREALEDALQAFPGSLLLVSHDRALLDAVGTRTVAVEGGTLHSHLGGWAEYVRVREERKAAGEEPPSRARRRAAAEPARAAKAERPKPAPGPSKNRLRDQSRAERAVEAAESALAALEQELSDPSAWSTKYESAKNEARHTAAKRAVDTAYSELETLLEP
jgi:ATP-binding cassette subfamily F protein 3